MVHHAVHDVFFVGIAIAAFLLVFHMGQKLVAWLEAAHDKWKTQNQDTPVP